MSDDVRQRLAELGQQRREAIEVARLGAAALALVKEAREARVPMVEIADLLGVHRQSVYELVQRGNGAQCDHDRSAAEQHERDGAAEAGASSPEEEPAR